MMVKNIFSIAFLLILFSEKLEAAAADEAETKHSQVARLPRGSHCSRADFLNMSVLYGGYQDGSLPESSDDARHYYQGQFSDFPIAIRQLNWAQGGQEKTFLSTFVKNLFVTLDVYIETFLEQGSTPRDGNLSERLEKLYPQIRPVIAYAEQTFFNPLAQVLISQNVIQQNKKAGVIKVDEQISFGYSEDTPGQYLFIPILPEKSIPLTLWPITFGESAFQGQTCFLMQGKALITNPGLLIDRADGSLRIRKHYGADESHPFRFSNSMHYVIDFSRNPTCNYFRTELDKLSAEEGSRKSLFVSFPKSYEEEEILSLLLLEEMGKECNPEIQQMNLAFLHDYGYFAKESISQGNALAIMFHEEEPVATEPSSPISDKPYTAIIKELQDQTAERLRETQIAQIRAEQEEIRLRVIADTEQAARASVPGKAKQGKKVSASPRQAPPAEKPLVTEEFIARKADISLKVKKAQATGKFKHLLDVIKALRLGRKVTERRQGSHHVVSGDGVDPVTLVHPHGGDRRLPAGRVRNIIRTLVANFGAPR